MYTTHVRNENCI